jgi:hypothetical protein
VNAGSIPRSAPAAPRWLTLKGRNNKSKNMDINEIIRERRSDKMIFKTMVVSLIAVMIAIVIVRIIAR